MSQPATNPCHIALQFGRIKHFHEGLSEVSRQLGLQFASRAIELRRTHGCEFHFILPPQWHGMFGNDVHYHALSDHMRWPHRFPVDLDVWHGLHQHMRHRPPINTRYKLITVHDLNHVYAKTGLSLWWQKRRLSRHLHQADHLVAISEHAAADIRRHVAWTAPLDVIYNGVADLSAAPQTPIAELEGQAFLFHISRMSASKNVGTLIDMMAAWPEKLLVLAGPDGPEVQRHRARIQELKLNNVRFCCDVSESQKAWLYAHCSAFLFPSLLEGFGLPPIEAMHFGKPVIVAHRSCLPEICGEAAAYWHDFTPLAMREVVQSHIQRCQQEPGMPERVRQQARRYNWPEAAERYLALYTDQRTPTSC